jgi:hypothetical protein
LNPDTAMRILTVVLTVGLFGCGHSNGFYNDRTMPSTIDTDPCMSCGGTGDALQISVAAVVLVGLVVAKLSR